MTAGGNLDVSTMYHWLTSLSFILLPVIVFRSIR
jgi:hypothetical protein